VEEQSTAADARPLRAAAEVRSKHGANHRAVAEAVVGAGGRDLESDHMDGGNGTLEIGRPNKVSGSRAHERLHAKARLAATDRT
jgi:hypothetical protein